MRWIVFAVLAAASFSALAGAVDVNLSNDTIEAKYDSAAGAADWTFGGLYNRDDKSYALNVGLLATGDAGAGNSRIEGGLGGKIYTVHVPGSDVAALALGGQVRWFPGNGSFGFGGYAFYAPKVVTFVDGTNFYDAGLRGGRGDPEQLRVPRLSLDESRVGQRHLGLCRPRRVCRPYGQILRSTRPSDPEVPR